jgi:hypothetical protein
MDSLQDIMGKKNFTPPDEMTVVKDYVLRRYNKPCSVRLERGALILSVRGSALAATIQLERNGLIEACGLKQKLVIRSAG